MQANFQLSLHDRFGYRLAVLARRWRQRLDAELDAYGLSQATWRPLIHLASFTEPPRQCELAEALQIGGPALVRVLDNLEDMRLVERIQVDDDRRAHHVQLTREGRKLARRVYEIIVALERELLRDISAEDIEHSARVFAALEDRLATREPPARARPARRRVMPQTRTP